MNYEEMIDDKKLKLIKDNTEDLIRNYKNSSYQEKITSLFNKNPDLNLSNIEDKIIQKDPFVIALLRKDTTKQNISENVFFEYTGLIKLPASGKNAIRFNNSKSADFKINDWYGTQKYIKNNGGAQDNQVEDAALFAREGNKLNKKIIVCIDGDYGKVKIRKILAENNNCIITTADELKRDIDNGRYN